MVWSNEAEAALLVELYNAQTGANVLFRYQANLTESFTQARPEADLLLGTYINNPAVAAAMRPLDEALSSHPYRPVGPITAGGRWQESTRLVPLAFSLPLIVFRAVHAPVMTTATVSLASLREGARKLGSANAESSLPRLVLFPPRDPRGVYEFLRSQGVRFSVDAGGNPNWNDVALGTAIAALQEWRRVVHGPLEAELAVADRFLNAPPLRLLDLEYLTYIYMPSDELLRWSFFATRAYDFRVLTNTEGRVLPLESVVWAGVPRTAANAEGALAFLRWILDPVNQMAVARTKIDQRIDRFGLFGGFSTIPAVNEQMIADLYPTIRDRLPAPELLAATTIVPRYWDELTAAVLWPLLRRPDANGGVRAAEIRNAVRQWYIQRGD